MADFLRVHLRALWAWEGLLGRLGYVVLSLIAVAVEFRLIAAGKPAPCDDLALLAVVGPFAAFGLHPVPPLAVAIALLFAWVHFILAVKRLRHLGWNETSAVLAFVPTAGLILLVVLGLVPSWTHSHPSAAPAALLRGPWGRLVPRSDLGSAVMAAFVAAAVGFLGYSLCGKVEGLAGWTLGLLVPVISGCVLAVVFGVHQVRSFRACLVLGFPAGLLTLFLVGSVSGTRSSPFDVLLLSSPVLAQFMVAGIALGFAVQNRPVPPRSALRPMPLATASQEIWMRWEI